MRLNGLMDKTNLGEADMQEIALLLRQLAPVLRQLGFVPSPLQITAGDDIDTTNVEGND